MRRIVVILTAVLAAAGCAPEKPSDDETGEVPRNVRVLSIQPTNLDEFLTISGPARPLRGTDLSEVV